MSTNQGVRSQRRALFLLCSIVLGAHAFACGSAQQQRYDAMRASLREAQAGPRRERTTTDPFAGQATLDRATFVREVLRRNPSLEAARHAYRAALARYPAETALDDPMLEYALAPLTVASEHADFGQTITLSQKLPWPGKLSLAGDAALARAEAAREDFEAVRRRLAGTAAALFDEHYAVARSLEISDEHLQLVEDVKRAAEAQYAAGRGAQQESLAAEVERLELVQVQVQLRARRAVLVAQMNGLLRRDPEQALPPPPQQVEPSLHEPGSSAALRAEALENRPELRAAEHAIAAHSAEIERADRASYPDFGLMGSYSSMWAMTEHRFMLGVSLNLPIQLDARSAAREQANAERARAQAMLANESIEVAVEVESARQAVLEAQHVVRLLGEELLPAARATVDAAKIAFSTGQTGLAALLDAERSLRRLELRRQEALARLGRAWAELDRAVGRIAGLPNPEGEPS